MSWEGSQNEEKQRLDGGKWRIPSSRGFLLYHFHPLRMAFLTIQSKGPVISPFNSITLNFLLTLTTSQNQLTHLFACLFSAYLFIYYCFFPVGRSFPWSWCRGNGTVATSRCEWKPVALVLPATLSHKTYFCCNVYRAMREQRVLEIMWLMNTPLLVLFTVTARAWSIINLCLTCWMNNDGRVIEEEVIWLKTPSKRILRAVTLSAEIALLLTSGWISSQTFSL